MTDLRTRAGREEEIINAIRKDGGLSVFWATENQVRAGAVDRLIRNGTIKRIMPIGQFPFCEYEVMK